jgi:hypothetical protein
MTAAKFLVALVGAFVAAVAAALTDDVLTDVEKVQIGIAVATAASVWVAANVPTMPAAKTVVAVVLAVLNLAVGLITDGMQSADWWMLAVAAFTAAGVFATPNAGDRVNRAVT